MSDHSDHELVIVIPYRELCDELMRDNPNLSGHISSLYPNLEEEQLSKILQELNKRFIPHYRKKLKDVSYNKTRFVQRNTANNWLKGEFIITLLACQTDKTKLPNNNTNSGGRPVKSVIECGYKARQYKIKKVFPRT